MNQSEDNHSEGQVETRGSQLIGYVTLCNVINKYSCDDDRLPR